MGRLTQARGRHRSLQGWWEAGTTLRATPPGATPSGVRCQAKQLAVEYVRSNVKFLFQEAEIPAPVMFDVKSKAGTLIILINTKHPARAHFFDAGTEAAI